MTDRLHVTAETYADIIESLKQKKRIGAIKILRSATGSGLKEAKNAIERLEGRAQTGPIITPAYDITGVKVRTPDGIVEVDLEGLQLLGLQALPSLGLETCRHVLSLVDTLKAWQESYSFNPEKDLIQDEPENNETISRMV